MNQTRMGFWVLIFLSLSTVAAAQQATKADIQSLELKLTQTITEMDKRLSNQIVELDKRITALEITVKEMDKRLTSQVQAVNARIDELDRHIGTLINILIGVVLAAIALPQVLGYLQGRRERAEIKKQMQELGQHLERQQQVMFEKLSQQQQQIDALRTERFAT
ncbi:MAG: hypothetical protein ACE5PV_01390 [Candidatus Poribacteria bacterium]